MPVTKRIIAALEGQSVRAHNEHYQNFDITSSLMTGGAFLVLQGQEGASFIHLDFVTNAEKSVANEVENFLKDGVTAAVLATNDNTFPSVSSPVKGLFAKRASPAKKINLSDSLQKINMSRAGSFLVSMSKDGSVNVNSGDASKASDANWILHVEGKKDCYRACKVSTSVETGETKMIPGTDRTLFESKSNPWDLALKRKNLVCTIEEKGRRRGGNGISEERPKRSTVAEAIFK